MSKPAMLDCVIDELTEIGVAVEQQVRAEQLLCSMLGEVRGSGSNVAGKPAQKIRRWQASGGPSGAGKGQRPLHPND